jgi:hypothetical protein
MDMAGAPTRSEYGKRVPRDEKILNVVVAARADTVPA